MAADGNFPHRRIPGLTGSGGGGKGGSSSSSTPTEAPNTLRSKTIARLIDILSEGEIEGPAVNDDWEQSIFLDDVPIKSAGGTYNFEGAQTFPRLGLPGQDYIDGFPAAETPVNVAVEVTNGSPVTRRVTATEVDAVRVVAQLSALTEQDTETGDLDGQSVIIEIWVKADADNGASQYVRKVRDQITGKTTSAYQRAYRIALEGTAPFDIQMRRITADRTETTIQDNTFWSSYTEITDAKLIYPDTALVGMEVDAEQFGTAIPRRAYEIKGLKVQIPSNMDGTARTFTGEWNGTFKTEYTDDPAWIVYDLLLNDRYGLGDIFDAAQVDKWDFYQLSVYNSVQVDDGAGGTEPRFSFNGAIASRENALQVIDAVAGMMRASMLWDGTGLSLIQQAPKNPSHIFSPANVVEGKFNYAGTSLTARHSVVHVTWWNPAKNYTSDLLVIEDAEAIQRYGYNVLTTTAYGCTSQAQAYRHGLMQLLTEKLETDAVQFKTGLGHADVRPGDVIQIMDPLYATASWAGRVKANPSTTTIQLDREITLANDGTTYELTWVGPDNELVTKEIDEAATGYSATDTVTLTTTISAGEVPNTATMWVISSSTLEPREFWVLAVKEEAANEYQVTAVEYNSSKFTSIDNGVILPDDESTFSDLADPGSVTAPTSLTLEFVTRDTPSGRRGVLQVDWQDSDDDLVRGYLVKYQFGNDNWVTMPETAVSNVDIMDPPRGIVRVTVQAVNQYGYLSEQLPNDIDLTTGTASGKDLISNILVQGTAGVQWTGQDIHLTWDANSPYSQASLRNDGKDPYFRRFRVSVKNPVGGATLFTLYTTEPEIVIPYERLNDTTLRRSYFVDIAIQDIYGAFSNDARVTVSNPAPSLPTVSEQAGVGSLKLTFTEPDDADFVGIIVYASATSGFTADASTEVWRGKGETTLNGVGGGVVYYRYRAYDAFGEESTTLSAEQTSAYGAIPSAEDLDLTNFASGIEPIEIVDTLPNPSGYTGARVVMLTTDNQLYRYTGSAWTTSVLAGSVSGTLGAGNIPSLDVSKIVSGTFGESFIPTLDASKIGTGTFGSTRIADDAITSPKIAAGAVVAAAIFAGAVTADKIDTNAVTADKIAANTITAAEIAANTITSTQIASQTITASQIAANTLTAGQIAAGAISTSELAANAVTADKIGANQVIAGKIATNAITAGTVQAGAITSEKIAASAITADKMSTNFGTFEDYLSVGASGSTTDVTFIAGNNYNTTYRFWTGALSPSAAPFTLSKDGKLVARDLEIRNASGELIFDSTSGFTDVARNNMLLNSGTFVNPATASLADNNAIQEFTLFDETVIDHDIVIPQQTVDDSYTGSKPSESFSTSIVATVQIRTGGVGSYVNVGSFTLIKDTHYEVVEVIHWAPGGGLGPNGYVSYVVQGKGVYKGSGGEILVPTITDTLTPAGSSENYEMRVNLTGTFSLSGGLGGSSSSVAMADVARTNEFRDTDPGQGFLINDTGAVGGDVTNADTLGGQAGSYYLDRANHTGTISSGIAGTAIDSGTINASRLPGTMNATQFNGNGDPGGTAHSLVLSGAFGGGILIKDTNWGSIYMDTNGARMRFGVDGSGVAPSGQGELTATGWYHNGQILATQAWVNAQGFGSGGGGGDVTQAGTNVFTGSNTFNAGLTVSGNITLSAATTISTSGSNDMTVQAGDDLLLFADGGLSRLWLRDQSSVSELRIYGTGNRDAALYFGSGADSTQAGFYYDESATTLHFRGYDNVTKGYLNASRWVFTEEVYFEHQPVIVDTDTGASSFMVTRSGAADQGMVMYADDGRTYMNVNQDETFSGLRINLVHSYNGTPNTNFFELQNTAGQLRSLYYYQGTQMGDISVQDTTWFRINQNTSKNIYTPRLIRADGGVQAGRGSATSSGYSFAADSGDGMYSPADGQVAIKLNLGTAATFLTSTNSDLYLGTTSDYLLMSRAADGDGTIAISGNNQLYLNSNGVNRAQIDSNGIGSLAGIFWTQAGDGYGKFRLWGSDSNYAIGMVSAMTYGGLNDYAMTFRMNADGDRGFWWGDSADAKSDGAMSLTTGGILTVKSTITAGGNITANSDVRLKDIQGDADLDAIYEKMMQIQLKDFYWKPEYYPDREELDTGIIAQQVVEWFPAAMMRTSQFGIDDIISVDYGKLGLLFAVSSGQKHDQEIKELQAVNDNLIGRIEELESLLAV